MVERIFSEYLSGKGIYAIAEGLNRDGIPSPSGHDPSRNRHRKSGRGAWSKSAVRAILKNPRYTGFQVWNRQQRYEPYIDVNNPALGTSPKMRWNPKSEWLWSNEPSHEALVTLETYRMAEEIFDGPQRAQVRRERTKHTYLLSGHVTCSECDRRMQGSWNNGRPYYRCKFPAEYALIRGDHPKTIYVRESDLTPAIDTWLAQLFDDSQIDATCEALAAAYQEDPAEEENRRLARKRLASSDDKLRKYRLALEEGASPAIVSEWIADVEFERTAALAVLRTEKQSDHLTAQQIKDLVEECKGIASILETADPIDRKAVYDELNLDVTYFADGRMKVSAGPNPCTDKCVGGVT